MMKKYNLIPLCLITLLLQWTVFSQETNCDSSIEKAKALLNENSPFNDEDIVFNLIEPCALAGNADAENTLGILYLKGIGTEEDATMAFNLFSKAANKGYANAQYNLGRMYKEGLGCTISFKNAINWFKTATDNGHQRAAYSLGYMYYKGLGVEQDYSQAIKWFENSNDPMAKHFLGICYYQGYGTSVDEERALGILLNNDIPNSASILSYIKGHQREITEEAVDEILEENSDANEAEDAIENLEETATTPMEDLPKSEPVAIEDIVGAWVGKLVQYDWSGEKIERILPIKLSFDSTGNSIKLNYVFLEQEENIIASFQDDFMYFQTPFSFTLDKLYTSYKNELTLDYEIFSIDFKKQTISDNTYLIGNVDTYITNWKEYGQPTRIILKPQGSSANDENDEILLALAEQEDAFIKLYPVPFHDQLTVGYQLETKASVYIELISINGGNPIVILPTTPQEAGDYMCSIAVNPSIQEGLYVVRLIAGGQLYTRLIMKEN